MVKRYKTILSVLLCVLTVFAVITVTGVVDINKIINEREEGTTNAPVKTVADVFTTYTEAGSPLLETDIPGVFYAMSKNGDVSFFKAQGGNIEKLSDVGVFDVTVTCSGQKLPVTIHYVEVDGRTAGYGLFTNAEHPDVFLYEYAFFKLTDQFDSYASRSDLLLLADTEKSRFYDEDKVYSESFYLYESKETKNFLNEDQRIVDLNAKLRADYKMFTDDILHQTENKILFFSSRFYNDYGHSEQVDIFISGGYGENVDNNRHILDVASLNFWKTEDGIRYFKLKNTEDTDAAGVSAFSLMNYNDENSREIISFDGSLKEDFIISGTKLFSIKTGEIYDVVTGENTKFDYGKFSTSFTPDLFKAGEDGKYCLIRGKSNLGKPSLAIVDTQTGEAYTYTDNVFGHIASMQALSDGTIILSLAASETAESYYQLTAKIGEADALAEAVG